MKQSKSISKGHKSTPVISGAILGYNKFLNHYSYKICQPFLGLKHHTKVKKIAPAIAQWLHFF